MNLIGVIYSNMGQSLLTGAKMTQRQLYITKGLHTNMGNSSQKLETQGTLHSLQVVQQVGELSFQGIHV